MAEDGFGDVTVKVLADRPHASLVKAAAIVGIGRSNVSHRRSDRRMTGFMNNCHSFLLQVIDVYDPTTKGINFQKLEELLASSTPENKIGFIVSPSFGEVNTVRILL